jgi:hypothetical protein
VSHQFDARVKRVIELIIDHSGNTNIPHNLIHSTDGAAAPNYHFNRHLMWDATKHMALNDDPCAPKLSLIAEPSSTTAHAQIDAKWLTTESLQYMTPSQPPRCQSDWVLSHRTYHYVARSVTAVSSMTQMQTPSNTS